MPTHLLEVLTPDELGVQAKDGRLEETVKTVRDAEKERAEGLTRLGMKVHDDLTIVSTRL